MGAHMPLPLQNKDWHSDVHMLVMEERRPYHSSKVLFIRLVALCGVTHLVLILCAPRGPKVVQHGWFKCVQ